MLSVAERDRRWQQVRAAMAERALGALIIWGSGTAFRNVAGNLRYMTNVNTEGYLLFPVAAAPTLYTFVKKVDASGWIGDWRTGHPGYGQNMAERLRQLGCGGGRVGIVGTAGYYGEMGFPHATYAALAAELPQLQLVEATAAVEVARQIKSPVEIACLEQACALADQIVRVVREVARVGVRDFEVRAAVMDAMFRIGCEPGSMLLYCAGREHHHAGQGGYFAPPGARTLAPGDVLNTEFDAVHEGYVAQYNQPYAVGAPGQPWERVIETAIASYRQGLQTLRPGVTVGELDDAMLEPLRAAGYTHTAPPFHGLGLGLEEPFGTFPNQPGYRPDAAFRLATGTVLELEPHVVTPDHRCGVHLGIPVLVTDTGCRPLSATWQPVLQVL